jgi:flavin reductase (DIM6/NTAB) family NADH-FMN oxidoreductase RutF
MKHQKEGRAMDKIDLGPQIFMYPMPVAIVGTMVEEKPNFMTVAWLSRVNLDPPLMGVAISKTHFTALGIRQSNSFSVNFPSRDSVEKTDFVGMASGRKIDKASVFELFFGKLKTVPMIRECPLSLECRLYSTCEFPNNDLFVGEVVASYTEERFLTDGKPDITKIRPFLLTMPDNNYWSLGERIAGAWEAGKPLLKDKG